MEKVYSNSLSGHIVYEHCPNPQFKICLNEQGELYMLHLILPEDVVKIEILKFQDCLWFSGGRFDSDIVLLRCNWMPKEIIVGVKGGRYTEDSKLSQLTGYVQGFNTGTSSLIFKIDRVHYALEILKKNGFEINPEILNNKNYQSYNILQWEKELYH